MDTNKMLNRQEIDRQAAINAVLAEDAYREPERNRRYIDDKGKVRIDINGETFEVIKDFDRKDGYKDGFQATIYRNLETKEIHAAIRGSEEKFQDLFKTDLVGMGFLKYNPQINDMEKFCKELMNISNDFGKIDGINPKIYLTGHSLGGTLAQYGHHYLGERVHQTFTFNAYGAASLGHNQQVPKTEDVPVYNYRTEHDVVSGTSAHYGKVLTYRVKSLFTIFLKLKLKKIR